MKTNYVYPFVNILFNHNNIVFLIFVRSPQILWNFVINENTQTLPKKEKNLCFYFFYFLSPLENYSLIGDVTIANEGLQMLTFALHLLPFSSEGSLVCLTNCDTGNPFIYLLSLISPRTHDTHLMPSVWHWSCHCLY